MAFVNYLENHPIVGASIWLVSIIGNLLLKLNFDSHIPNLIMDSMQMLVWTVGILAGLVTINGWYKTHKKNKKK